MLKIVWVKHSDFMRVFRVLFLDVFWILLWTSFPYIPVNFLVSDRWHAKYFHCYGQSFCLLNVYHHIFNISPSDYSASYLFLFSQCFHLTFVTHVMKNKQHLSRRMSSSLLKNLSWITLKLSNDPPLIWMLRWRTSIESNSQVRTTRCVQFLNC